jgi:NAD(P)-dependent dehydrogenase (short-subunit alcohol dehydrogenase family)
MAKTTPDMSGKVCLITGATSGIGKATAKGLAAAGAIVVMVCRDAARGEAARKEVAAVSPGGAVSLLKADLASFDSIRALAEEFQLSYNKLDVLINNAATIGSERRETVDGIESQFAVNHLAYFLLTNLLLDRLKASAPARIVNVASIAHRGVSLDLDDLENKKEYKSFRVYGQTKLANVLFSHELARRLQGTGVTANCLHPGIVRSNIVRDMMAPISFGAKFFGFLMLSPDKGAATTIHCATAPELEETNGKYFVRSAIAPSSEESHDKKLANRLWEISAEMVGL